MSEPAENHRTPFDELGEEKVRRLTEAFYDAMRRLEPALADLHECEPDGRVNAGTRERFGLFLIGWLGGPQTYSERHGHPRLRMRHARVPVNLAMRDAWLRSMQAALDAEDVQGPVRKFLDQRFAEVADFLRNQPE
jgi:hemoglobin